MPYEKKEFSHLDQLEGLSSDLIQNHLTLYEGYVKNTNSLLEILDTAEVGTVEYSEIQRRFGWEWNGMRLHELYFENIHQDSKGLDEKSEFGEKMLKIYGSIESWQKNFQSVGAMRGIGWVALYFDKDSGELFNIWVNEHDVGHLAGATPLLVMDVFEHAYMLDYGTKKVDYIEAFIKLINWEIVEKRFNK